ncbi:MAG: substrate-binding domain-containing protein [Pseudomonadota bacterium]
MNGIELAQVALQRRPALRVLFTSGYAETLAESPALAGPVLQKPYRFEELLSRLDARWPRIADLGSPEIALGDPNNLVIISCHGGYGPAACPSGGQLERRLASTEDRPGATAGRGTAETGEEPGGLASLPVGDDAGAADSGGVGAGAGRRHPGRFRKPGAGRRILLAAGLRHDAGRGPAARELGIDVDIRYTKRDYQSAMDITKAFLAEQPPLDYLIVSNDIGAGGPIIKLADQAGVPLILLSNDLDPGDWAEYGEPRTKYRRWLGSIVPDHEGGGYEIAEQILSEAKRLKSGRPLRLIALGGDAETPASIDRDHGRDRALGVFQQLLGKGAVEQVAFEHLDWTDTGGYAWTKRILPTVPRVDAVWAANDPLAFGALRALHEAGYQPGKDVVVGGLNWSQARSTACSAARCY